MNRRLLIVSAAIVVTLGMTGCTAPRATPRLARLGSLAGTTILRLENQHGSGAYGPYKRESKNIAIDFNCLGPGTTTVTVVGVGAVPNHCGGAGSSVRVIFGVQDGVDSFTVRVDGPSEVQWSLGVSAATAAE